MAWLKIFGSKPNESMETVSVNTPVENTEETSKDEELNKNEDKKKDEQKFITIKWGTGMPIDVIFNFIHKNFEDEGYEDALVNSDMQYRETKEEIIRNDLKMLFKRISLRYRNDIREIGAQIENAQKAYALTSASLLQARCDTYREHLEEIAEMERLLDSNDPKMTTMIESYRRGFLKGIAAITLKFINNN